jgi:hypothetical protein
MPYKDAQKHRDYYREYMRKRAAAKRAGQAAPKPPSAPEINAELERLRAENARLTTETLTEKLDKANTQLKGLRTQILSMHGRLLAQVWASGLPDPHHLDAGRRPNATGGAEAALPDGVQRIEGLV